MYKLFLSMLYFCLHLCRLRFGRLWALASTAVMSDTASSILSIFLSTPIIFYCLPHAISYQRNKDFVITFRNI